ncbi:MAG TPA: DUF4388 domain-containing protein [Candidatus Polarisedimenticolaceae bacterium]|nr:DUF4388 domain-containing protein [Candidatus Polarisedimenticolaceae bacterium]
MRHDRPTEIPSTLLAGRLEGISVPDLLWSLCRHRSTGVLRVQHAGIEKRVYVEGGQIVFASSSDPDDRLGERFLRAGWITIEQLDRAVERLAGGKRLGTLLVEDGSLEAGQLVTGVLNQVESIVLDVFEWEDGDYRFDEGLPTEEMIKLEIKTSELLLRGIRQLRSFSRVRRSVGSTQKIYGLTEEWESLLDGVSLTAGEQSLVGQLGEGELSIEALCREVFLSNFEIYQTMWALKVLGVVEEREELWMAPSDVTVHGSLDQIDFTELLVSLARSNETGVLYVTRGERERSFHIAGGRCVFATSSNPDDGLMAYLLRRGVISLRDREETAKRLLSNKRVGAILRDLGVIDQQDLQSMVREQLSEVVYDTFRWTDALYAFVPGPLPTVEEITLEADLDALVASGIRRVESWSRVWHGCGGIDVTLELKPSYLAVLDAMAAGPEEWEVIAALKKPCSPREVCARTGIGDFRVCQILWTLRVLGGVEAVGEVAVDLPLEPSAELDAAAGAAVKRRSRALLSEDRPGRPLIADQAIEQAIVGMERDLDDQPVEVAGEPPGIDRPELRPSAVVRAEREADESERRSPEATQALTRDEVESAIAPAVDAAVDEPGADTETEPPPDATQVIPREVVEAAVSGADEPAVPARPNEHEHDSATTEPDLVTAAAAVDDDGGTARDWELPPEVDSAIARFNAAQRVVYRTIRAEVGAGAANFIRSCCSQLDSIDADVVAGVDLNADGSWETDGLREAVRKMRSEDPWLIYQRLIEGEIDRLRPFIGDAKAAELQKQVELVGQPETGR